LTKNNIYNFNNYYYNELRLKYKFQLQIHKISNCFLSEFHIIYFIQFYLSNIIHLFDPIRFLLDIFMVFFSQTYKKV